MKVTLDNRALAETCSLLAAQAQRRRNFDNEAANRLNFALLKQALLDYELSFDWRQGLQLSHPDFGEISLDECERWIFDDDFFEWVPIERPASAQGWYCRRPRDGICSLAGICDVLNLEISWIRRRVSAWRNKRLAGGVDRLVPPQHDRGEAADKSGGQSIDARVPI